MGDTEVTARSMKTYGTLKKDVDWEGKYSQTVTLSITLFPFGQSLVASLIGSEGKFPQQYTESKKRTWQGF